MSELHSPDRLSHRTRTHLIFWSALIYLLFAPIGYGIGLLLLAPLLGVALFLSLRPLRLWRIEEVRPKGLLAAGMALTAVGLLLLVLGLADVGQQVYRGPLMMYRPMLLTSSPLRGDSDDTGFRGQVGRVDPTLDRTRFAACALGR